MQSIVGYGMIVLLVQLFLSSFFVFQIENYLLGKKPTGPWHRLKWFLHMMALPAAILVIVLLTLPSAKLLALAGRHGYGNRYVSSSDAGSESGGVPGEGSQGSQRGPKSQDGEDTSPYDVKVFPVKPSAAARDAKNTGAKPIDTPTIPKKAVATPTDAGKLKSAEAKKEGANKEVGEDAEKLGGTTGKQDGAKKPETEEKSSVQDRQQASGKPALPDTATVKTKPDTDNKPGEQDKPVEKDRPDADNKLKVIDKADVRGKSDAPDKPDEPDKAGNSSKSNDSNKPGEKGDADGTDKGKPPNGPEDAYGNPNGRTANLRNKPGTAAESDANDDKHAGKNSGKGGMLSLATKQEGKPDETAAPPPDKPSAVNPLQQPSASFWPQSLIPSSLPVARQPAKADSTNDGKPSERPKLEGSLPPFRYSGATQELFKKYPRMEVAWVLDREPGGPERPQVVLEVVLDADGDVHWRNLQSEQRSRFFTDVTVSHILRERIVASSAKQLRLGSDSKLVSKALSEAALTSAPPTRMTWGFYRHQAETYELGRAARAFLKAADRGIVNFQPQRADYLDIRWAADSQGDVSVSSVRFCPEKGKPIDLPLPKE